MGSVGVNVGLVGGDDLVEPVELWGVGAEEVLYPSAGVGEVASGVADNVLDVGPVLRPIEHCFAHHEIGPVYHRDRRVRERHTASVGSELMVELVESEEQIVTVQAPAGIQA